MAATVAAATVAALSMQPVVAGEVLAQAALPPRKAVPTKELERRSVPDSVLATLPKTIKIPSTDEGLLAERDMRARGIMGYLNCMEVTLRAIKRGALGAIAPSWSVVCVEQANEWRGVAVELTTTAPGAIVHKQFALRGANNGVVVQERIDTATVSAVARSMRRALGARATPNSAAMPTSMVPAVLPQRTFVEIWFIPVPGNPAAVFAGGDSVIQMASDGNRELGHSSTSPALTRRTVQSVARGAVVLPSIENRLPLVSELVAARTLLAAHPEVRVRTGLYELSLARGRTATWTIRAR